MNDEISGISVVICTYNGANRLPACLDALESQTWRGELEIVVVDDNSRDDISDMLASYRRVRLMRNGKNLGPAGSRNVGIRAARHDLIVFTDDDCRPENEWLERLAEALTSHVMAIGGATIPHSADTLLWRFLSVNNPLAPLESDVAGTRSTGERLFRYCKGLIGTPPGFLRDDVREVYSVPSANLGVRAGILAEVGAFDESFGFSGEDQDLCRRINLAHLGGLIFVPQAIVRHEYKAAWWDTIRRSRVYAHGNVALRRKYPEVARILFPIPVAWMLATCALMWLNPITAFIPTCALPLCYPVYLRLALRRRSWEPFAYVLLQFLQDTAANWGFFEAELGKWRRKNTPAVGGEYR
jgi:GT2 family glycosyltransferase